MVWRPRAILDGTTERHDVCATDTQYVVQISGYDWALRQLAGAARLRVLDAACGVGYGTDVLARGAASAVGVDAAPAAPRHARRPFPAPAPPFAPLDRAPPPCPPGASCAPLSP